LTSIKAYQNYEHSTINVGMRRGARCSNASELCWSMFVEITRIRDLIEAFITQELKPGLPESTAARTHRQPTPSSIGAAQVELGQTSQEEFNAVKVDVALALQADAVGDQSACEQALADAKRLLDSAGSQTDGARR
jgi:hypothetical protein